MRRIIRCPSRIKRLSSGSDSYSDFSFDTYSGDSDLDDKMEGEGSHLDETHEDVSGSSGHHNREGEQTLVNKTDLASIISLNSRNNYGKVVGLKYFVGGRDKDPANPTFSCTTSVKQWVKDIDARTADNWTDLGKIQLAKQHALGPAFRLITTTVEAVGYDWNKVKEQLLEVFPDEKTYFERKADLATARRQSGETLSEFWVRLHEAATLLEKERPENKVSIQEDKVTAFLTALPKHFQTYLTDNDMKNPSVVYKKATQFVRNNPQLKLTNADLMKETRQHVAAVSSSTRPRASPQDWRDERRKPPNNATVCFRCKKLGHVAQYCRADMCKTCGLVGHYAAICRRSQAGRGRQYGQDRYPSQGRYPQAKKNANYR